MTPVGKIMKLLLAMTVTAAIALGVAGCKKDEAPAEAPRTEAPKAEAPKAEAAPGEKRVIEIKVTENGYEPSPITLTRGQPVELKVTRTTDATCATEFILDEYKIEEKLPLNETVTINFTPEQSGELKYGCAMGKMISGRFRVE